MRILRLLRAGRAAVLVAVALVVGTAALAGDPVPAVRELRAAQRSTLPPPDMDAFLGVVLDEHTGSAVVASVVAGSAAEAAGLVAGDVLTAVDATPVTGSEDLAAALAARGAGAPVRLAVTRGGRTMRLAATVGRRRRADDCFRGSRFELAVVPLRFADDTAAPADAAGLTRLLFRKTGTTSAGASLADYYRAQSLGRLDVEGRVLAPVTLPGLRDVYASQPMGGSPASAFAAAAEVLVAREGAAAMGAFDGIAFLYAGAGETRSGFALWPHRSTVAVGDRRLPYYVHAAGDPEAATIGVHCHEFGHLLGLPDSYGTGHVTGSGDFCLMSIGHRGGPTAGARVPFGLCAWCRARLGWVEPVAVDPRTPQRLRLAPSARAGGDTLLVPLTPRADEYLLVEVRRREGFDAELPSAGLFVWHVGGAPTPGQGRFGSYIDLVEAHGLDCVDASMVRTGEIAFPTARARDLTPETRPSIASSAPDAFHAYLTSIESRPDGCVDVTLGVARRIEQSLPGTSDAPPPDDEGFVVRTDPVTGRGVRLYVGPDGTSAPPVPESPAGGERR